MNKSPVLMAAILVLGVLSAEAQTRYDLITDRNLWNGGRNVGGMRLEAPLRASYAEASGGFLSGDFKAPWDAASSWNAGAVAKTRTDFEQFSVTGSFSFAQKQGQGMCGSMFIHPGYYPVDVLEFTPGRKALQTYSFMGGIAVPLDGRWTVGGRMDFESDNYSKRKDIRHTNYRLDLTVAPSVTLDLGNWAFGASGVFRKTSESIQAEQVGTATADSYYAFLDKGLMYGSYQVWDGSGIHLSDPGINRFAVKEYSLGAAMQASRNFSGGSLYADAEYLSTAGEVGEKSYTFYKFPGASLTARLGYLRHGRRGDNIFRVEYSWKKQSNDEYVIDKVSQGGVVNPVTYGHNRIFDRRELSLVPSWTFYGGKGCEWLYKAHIEAGWTEKKQMSQPQFPYSYDYSTDILSAAASAILRFRQFRFGAGMRWMKGSWEEEGLASGSEGGGGAAAGLPLKPVQQTALRWEQVEWENASRFGGELSLTWYLPWSKARGLYLSVAGSMLRGTGVRHLGTTAFGGMSKLGYEF